MTSFQPPEPEPIEEDVGPRPMNLLDSILDLFDPEVLHHAVANREEVLGNFLENPTVAQAIDTVQTLYRRNVSDDFRPLYAGMLLLVCCFISIFVWLPGFIPPILCHWSSCSHPPHSCLRLCWVFLLFRCSWQSIRKRWKNSKTRSSFVHRPHDLSCEASAVSRPILVAPGQDCL